MTTHVTNTLRHPDTGEVMFVSEYEFEDLYAQKYVRDWIFLRLHARGSSFDRVAHTMGIDPDKVLNPPPGNVVPFDMIVKRSHA